MINLVELPRKAVASKNRMIAALIWRGTCWRVTCCNTETTRPRASASTGSYRRVLWWLSEPFWRRRIPKYQHLCCQCLRHHLKCHCPSSAATINLPASPNKLSSFDQTKSLPLPHKRTTTLTSQGCQYYATLKAILNLYHLGVHHYHRRHSGISLPDRLFSFPPLAQPTVSLPQFHFYVRTCSAKNSAI